jgi:hypothetical protein
MQFVVLLMLVAAGTFDFLVQQHLLPSVMGFIPELAGAIALAYVAVMSVRTRFELLSPPVAVIMVAIVVTMICGLIVNAVNPGPLFAGMRTYLRAIPFFLLPTVLVLSEKQLSTQLKVLLGVAMLQLPLATAQRWLPHHAADDSIFGTFMLSSFLSIFLICAACIAIGFYLRGRIRLPILIILLAWLLIPTTINETKGTLVLLPIAFIVTFIIGARSGARIKNTLIAAGLLFAAGSAFVAAYDYTQKDKVYAVGIIEFYTGERAESYLESNKGFSTDREDIKRLDALKLAYSYLSRDPVQLTFGLGIGNASRSSLGPSFEGQYTRLFTLYMYLSAVRLLIETGILGLSLVILLMLALWREAYIVSRQDTGLLGAVAAGWLGVIMVLIPAFFYKDVISSNGITFFFWYIAGLIAARRMQLAKQEHRRELPAAGPPLKATPLRARTAVRQ